MTTTEERFWAKVQKADGCWLWTAKAKTSFGYGVFRFNGRNEGAHRVAWTLTNGPIPNGAYVLHSCDTPACVKPAHLRLGTAADNMRDKSDRGRWRGGGKPKEYCARGHKDWYVNGKTGWKYCRPCRAAYLREWRLRRLGSGKN